MAMKRQLMALLSADVEGYSSLMSDNEEATIQTLTAYRTVIGRHIRHHHGRVVDTTGDNFLAAFGSVTHAVQGAMAVQQAIREHNADLPAHRAMAFRMGINLGDVVRQGRRIYGNSVNIAARLESLAEAGGIHISGAVYDQVASKLSLPFVYLGEQVLKNIAEPVRVYRIDMPTPARALRVYAGGGSLVGDVVEGELVRDVVEAIAGKGRDRAVGVDPGNIRGFGADLAQHAVGEV